MYCLENYKNLILINYCRHLKMSPQKSNQWWNIPRLAFVSTQKRCFELTKVGNTWGRTRNYWAKVKYKAKIFSFGFLDNLKGFQTSYAGDSHAFCFSPCSSHFSESASIFKLFFWFFYDFLWILQCLNTQNTQKIHE